MTITPLVYVKEQATAGTPDQTGIMVKTSFSFKSNLENLTHKKTCN